jgi:hypothetical protein
MSEEDSSVTELLRSAAAQAEQAAPAFDAERIVATAQRRRPWLAAGEALRRGEIPYRPAIAFAVLLVAIVVIASLFASNAFSSGASHLAAGTTTTLTLPSTTTSLPSGSTSVPPSTTAPPPTTFPNSVPVTTTPGTTTTPVTTTTVPPTSTTAATSTTTSVPTSTTSTTIPPQSFTAVYMGVRVTLVQIDYIDPGQLGATPDGTVTGFRTKDAAFHALEKGGIDVWTDVPAPYNNTDEYVVSTSAQPGDPPGSWYFYYPPS